MQQASEMVLTSSRLDVDFSLTLVLFARGRYKTE